MGFILSTQGDRVHLFKALLNKCDKIERFDTIGTVVKQCWEYNSMTCHHGDCTEVFYQVQIISATTHIILGSPQAVQLSIFFLKKSISDIKRKEKPSIQRDSNPWPLDQVAVALPLYSYRCNSN